MEQLADRGQRIVRGNCAGAVDGTVAERVDDPRLAEDRFARRLFEAWLVDQRGDLVVVGKLERLVVFVCPGDRQLQGATRVEAGRPRIAMNGNLASGRRLVDVGPFATQESELAHRRASADGSSVKSEM